jgi:hypothetical protein
MLRENRGAKNISYLSLVLELLNVGGCDFLHPYDGSHNIYLCLSDH